MVEERTQRRLAAILAADVVGFSRLMEADESGTMAALKVRRKEVLDPPVARISADPKRPNPPKAFLPATALPMAMPTQKGLPLSC
jgi:hypothetical protein